jgi:protein-tyrosine phosphatase
VSDWLDDVGVATLPSGLRVRGRPLARTASPADFALVLTTRGPLPSWPYRRVRWPDYWIPTDRDDALAALQEAYDRARRGERVEAACHGGRGRTGTALAALAVLDGLTPDEAFRWVRSAYDPWAVEMPWQKRWLRVVR